MPLLGTFAAASARGYGSQTGNGLTLYFATLLDSSNVQGFYKASNCPYTIDFNGTGLYMSGDASTTGNYVNTTVFPQNIEVSVSIQLNDTTQYCNDHSIMISAAGTEPQWNWGSQPSRIAFQNNCKNPYIYGHTTNIQGTGDKLATTGWLTMRAEHNRTAGTCRYRTYVGFDQRAAGWTGTVLTDLTLSEVINSSSLWVSLGADQDTPGNGLSQFRNLYVSII